MFDLTHRTEADGSVVARVELPCTLHLTSSDFGNDYCWREVRKTANTIGFGLEHADPDVSDGIIDAMDSMGGNGAYYPLDVLYNLVEEVKEEEGEMPPAFQKFLDTYGITWVTDYGDTALDGIDGYGGVPYVEQTVEMQTTFHHALTAAVAACKTWREDITQQLEQHVNEVLGSKSGLWNVEILEPIEGKNRRCDAAFRCNIFYETRVQA